MLVIPHARVPAVVVLAVAADDDDAVLQAAWSRAAEYGHQLVVCSVVADAGDREQVRLALAARLVRVGLPGPPSRVDVRVGDRAAQVLACVAEREAVLLTLGASAHRDGVLARIFNPTLAAALVRGASSPILVTRRPSGPGCILAATDLDAATMPVLQAAAAETARTGGDVIAVHCVEQPAMPMIDGHDAPMVTLDDVVRTADLELHHALAQVGLSQELARVEAGPTVETVVRLAGELAAALVIVGSHGRSGVARVLLGSAAEEILRDAPCSVLVIPRARAHAVAAAA